MGLYSKNLFSSFTSASSWFEVYAAFSTLMILLRTAINDLIPHQFRSFVISKLEGFFKYQPHSIVSIKINQFWDEGNHERNELFDAALAYLPTKITHTYKSLKVGRPQNQKHIELAVDGSEDVMDEFEGVKFTWKLDEGSNEESSFRKLNFVLAFNEKQRQRVLDRYIPHVFKTYEAMKNERRILKLYSRIRAIGTKNDIIDDLDRFLRRKDFYKKVGKPWKRGYLLYGPPGTGKSSLIAAIANHLKFDVYDLELSSIDSNSELMRAMRDASHRCIIVIEDIDCNKEVHARSKPNATSEDRDSESENEGSKMKSEKFTLSGLLNYMDGLCSSGGEERIVIFTTNHKEKIDHALLRPGRMDMHIHLSFLKGKAFRVLASNYLGIEGDHPLLHQIDDLLEKIEITPAVVGEQLLRYEDPDLSLEELVQFLKQKVKVKDRNCD
ncbi:mitochondrial chaperone BCS1 [Vigna unguiculata]|uniref:Mitochondrial chaperone BCS1 n=1 Tax=Vigna unguiculata TaxID=3917 RepID=A0A4D6LRF0_VIGUN|nr:mitochondrial chaperone BCS1 [Vigna unguiculata]